MTDITQSRSGSVFYELQMEQAAFPSGQKRYSTVNGSELKVVSLAFALMMARKLDEAEATLAQRSETGAWISFNDRMPEGDGCVLACYANGEMAIYTKRLARGYAKDDPPLTHWMPMPEAPK